MPKFWWYWGYITPTPPTGQSPRGSRYRWNSRVNEIYRFLWIGLIPWSHILH